MTAPAVEVVLEPVLLSMQAEGWCLTRKDRDDSPAQLHCIVWTGGGGRQEPCEGQGRQLAVQALPQTFESVQARWTQSEVHSDQFCVDQTHQQFLISTMIWVDAMHGVEQGMQHQFYKSYLCLSQPVDFLLRLMRH